MTVTKTLAEISEEIRTGDILLCSGTAVFSRLIQQATKSEWSHVGVLARLPSVKEPLVMESVEDFGVRCVPLSYYVANYDGKGVAYPGEILVARVAGLEHKDPWLITETAISHLGCRYDAEEIAKIALRLTLRSAGHGGIIGHENSYICSEYAYMCFKAAGVKIQHTEGDFVTPADFYNDPGVTPLAFLKGLR